MSFALRERSSFPALPGLSSNSSTSAAVSAGEALSQLPNFHTDEDQNKSHSTNIANESDIPKAIDIHRTKPQPITVAQPLELSRRAGSESANSSSVTAELRGRRMSQAEQEEDELEEGELDDSHWEDVMAPQNNDLDQTDLALGGFQSVVDEISSPFSMAITKPHSTYLIQQKQIAKTLIKASGLSFTQLAAEGLDTSMLKSIFQDLGLMTQQRLPSSSVSIDSRLKADEIEQQDKSSESQVTGTAKREEYLARLKALQRKSPRAHNGEAGPKVDVPNVSGSSHGVELHTSLESLASPSKSFSSTSEAAAISSRKERLARLREEALKSAKAAQARKELAATRAGQFLDENFGTHTPTSEISAPISSPMKRSLEIEDDAAENSSLKRPFGQARFGDERDDCIIEPSDDEADSDPEKPVSTLVATVGTSSNESPSHQQSHDSLEIHEQRISEMRQKIKALEQRSKHKILTGGISFAPSNTSHSVEILDRATTTDSPVSASTHAVAAHGMAGSAANDWMQQNREENDSPLLIHYANTSSDTSKFALLEKQTPAVEENIGSNVFGQNQFKQNLGQLGSHADLVPQIPSERLKARRDDQHIISTRHMENQQGEAVAENSAVQDERSPEGHKTKEKEPIQSSVEAETAAPDSESSMSISEEESLSDEGGDAQHLSTMDSDDSASDSEGLYEPPDITATKLAGQDKIAEGHNGTTFPFDAEGSTVNAGRPEQFESMTSGQSSLNEEARQMSAPLDNDKQPNTVTNDRELGDTSKQTASSSSPSQMGDSIYGDSNSEAQLGSNNNIFRPTNASDYSLSPMPEEEAHFAVQDSDEQMTSASGDVSSTGRMLNDAVRTAIEDTAISSDMMSHRIDVDEDYEPSEIAVEGGFSTRPADGLAFQPTISHSAYDIDQTRSWEDNSVPDPPEKTSQYQQNQYAEDTGLHTFTPDLSNASQPPLTQQGSEKHPSESEVGNSVLQVDRL